MRRASAAGGSRCVGGSVLTKSGRLLLLHCYSGYPMGVRTGRNAPRPRHTRHPARHLCHRTASRIRGCRLDHLDRDHAVLDNAFLNLGFTGGAVGRCWSTYQASGAAHGLRISVYGDRGSLSWDHEQAELLWWRPVDSPEMLLTKADPLATDNARAASRFSAGHPDGYGLAFANLYRDFAHALMADDPQPFLDLIPGIADGVHTIDVVEAAIRSHEADQQPVTLKRH